MPTTHRYRKTRCITPDPILWERLTKSLPDGEIRNASMFFDAASKAFLSGGKLPQKKK